MSKTMNNKCLGTSVHEAQGMIDSNAHLIGVDTLPLWCGKIDTKGIVDVKFRGDITDKEYIIVGKNLVVWNTKMYNDKKRCLSDENTHKIDIPSLIIASTMDMELAHYEGYDGVFIEERYLPLLWWDDQIKETENAMVTNPLRLFPLFSYDPRRYRLDNPSPEGNGIGRWWKEPFAHIVGQGDQTKKPIWLGFCMNPLLGFRPFDEFCKNLTMFYKECESKDIPILAHCAPEGIVTRDLKVYKEFDFKEDNITRRIEKSEERRKEMGKKDKETLYSKMYRGRNKVNDDHNFALNHFYWNYGHPRNWIPVLQCYPNLRLCLSGFGGNREWGHTDMSSWTGRTLDSLSREWIRCIIKLTRQYDNVYADISGLDILSTTDQCKQVKNKLMSMLNLIQEGNVGFKHLKHKLLFGSGGQLTEDTYGEHYNAFRTLFRKVDDTERLWEYVSLINPWNFYALSCNDKIMKIHDVLADSNNINCKILESMKSEIYGPRGVSGLVKYIAECNAADKKAEKDANDRVETKANEKPQKPDSDLMPIRLYDPDAESLREIAETVVTEIKKDQNLTATGTCDCKYATQNNGNDCKQGVCTISKGGPRNGSVCWNRMLKELQNEYARLIEEANKKEGKEATKLTEKAKSIQKKIESGKFGRCEKMHMACNISVQRAFLILTDNQELNGKILGNAMTANEMCKYLPTSSNFTTKGLDNEEITIKNMQKWVNEGHIVIAVASNANGNGHVVMGIPGDKQNGTWVGNDDGKVPIVMDTGAGKRELEIGISYSWGETTSQESVKFYRYKETTIN